MAYAESTLSGTYGNSYRVWVNSIRTWDGGPDDNSEDWRVEGGLNKIATGTSAYNGMNQASYTLQLGLNGVSSSGNFSYNFGVNQTGTVVSWGTGSTKVYRSSAGVGFGFQSRMDINLANSAIGSGWVTSNDSVQTKYRHASVSAFSIDQGGIPFTDEGPAWIEWSNPSGAAVDAWLEVSTGGSFNRVFSSPGGVSSRYNYTFNTALQQAIQQASPNSNSYTIRMGVHDSMGGDSWDYRDRTGTIKNDAGQANPTFANFTYKDTNGVTTAITGSDQVLIQGRSNLEVTVSTANKATPKKFATMSSYNVSLGGYSANATYSSTANVVQTVGLVSDVTGLQNLAVRAIDSRGNSTTVTKPVTILPYQRPAYYYAFGFKYTNGFDSSGGITATGYNGNTILQVSPMTLNGVDKNVVDPANGVSFDIAKGTGSFSGTYTGIPITQVAGTGDITMTPSGLGTLVLNRMNALGADNTVPWYIKIRITDKLETREYTLTIDIGRPIFRIGRDGLLYHNEVEFHQEFNPTDVVFKAGLQAVAVTGTWAYEGWTGVAFGPSTMKNTSNAINDLIYFPVYLNAGSYTITTSSIKGADAGISTLIISGGQFGTGIAQFDIDNYATAYSEVFNTTTGLVVQKAGTLFFNWKVTGKNASSTAYYQRIMGMRFLKVG